MTQQNKKRTLAVYVQDHLQLQASLMLVYMKLKKIKNAVILKHGDKTQFYPQRPFPKTEKGSTDNQMNVLGISARKQLLIPR